MSIDAKAHYAAAGFVVLLLLSLFWPSPFVSMNRLGPNADIGADELSFLGREAPSWDVIFWCLAGIFAIAIVQSAATTRDDLGAVWPEVKAVRFAWPRHYALYVAGVIAIVAATWFFADRMVVRWAEAVQSDTVEDVIRIFNRLGGGMNPVLIVVFLVGGGLAYRRRRWLAYGIGMAMAGAAAGIVAHILKFAFGRIRPELWLGPFHYARGAASSFPSGHTVGAFALAGVLMFASRNWPLRVTAFVLASAIALARILAFRHWASDVVASALIGLLAASIAAVSVTPLTTSGRKET